MAIQKRPYELSVWVEKLNGSNSKIEEKGVIIGAHDMSYPGKATDIVLKREIKGTNTLTFQLLDRYFDSLKGEFVRNEFADLVAPETKLKLFYKDRWFEFFVKKVDDKKQFKSYVKSFTCTDAFIDELSRNGYGITYDTELNNNVEEIGTFTEETLEDSIWQYHPENNWGDFTEYKEEKLYRIPISCFGGSINGYKLNFELEQEQRDEIKEKTGTDFVKNVFTGDERPVELSDDLARGFFWDEYVEDDTTRNALTKEYHTNIPNDGYIYVPYSCLGFCYGTEEEPDFTDELKYDRAATETAIAVDGKLILAPQSVDPRTIIQFYAIPKTGMLELDDGGVIMNKDYTFFMTLADWSNAVQGNKWYIFEDTRLVHAEVLGSADVAAPAISHTFRYLKENTDSTNMFESLGNKCVTYDGYLSDVNGNYIVKGKKFSITNRTEINISEDIDQYTTIYNSHADDFVAEYTNEDWEYKKGERTTDGKQYRVCSKLETRQIIPQLARNFVQNGIKMDSIDGWAPMAYLTEEALLTAPRVTQRGVIQNEDDMQISSSCLMFSPTVAQIAYVWSISHDNENNCDIGKGIITINGDRKTAESLNDSKNNASFVDSYYVPLLTAEKLYAIGTKLYTLGTRQHEGKNCKCYQYICDKNDYFYKSLIHAGQDSKLAPFSISPTNEIETITPDDDDNVIYFIDNGKWDDDFTVDGGNIMLGRKNTPAEEPKKTSVTSGTSIINFGIIGQDKIIEKEKIYCLGVQAIPKPSVDHKIADTFKIKIGRGSLVSEGNYQLSGNIIEFNAENLIDLDYTFNWTESGAADEKKNIVITDEPKTKFLLFKPTYDIENPYFVIECEGQVILLKLYLFEAYTKGIDSFSADEAIYRYSGRDLFWPPKGIDGDPVLITYNQTTVAERTQPFDYPVAEGTIKEQNIHCQIIFEDDIMLGSTYGYQHYYIQKLQATTQVGNEQCIVNCDTMGKKEFLSSDIKDIKTDSLPLDAAHCTSDDCKIFTNYIDLNRCSYYDKNADIDSNDCKYGDGHICFYQKFGYCPFRFKTEKHNRRVRTLSINKSNRFNIIQQTSKVFEAYPQFYIEHKTNGSIVKDEDGNYLKKIFYITEKGRENKLGFRYEKNLKDISRSIVSDKIVTKLYVLDVDSDLSKTGLCSIKTAEDNPSKDSYIIDLSYYVEKGMLDADEVEQDLYGVTPTSRVLEKDEIPAGFLNQLGYYNSRYDELSNKIINLKDASYTELEANLTVNYQGIITAQEQILKIKKQLDKYKEMYSLKDGGAKQQQSYQNYLNKLAEQQSTLTRLIDLTFFTDGICDANSDIWDEDCFTDQSEITPNMTPVQFFNHIIDLEESKKYWIDLHNYTKGILGQFNSEYLQIQQWQRERASYLKLINQISTAFYKKYEPYLKEGTWSDNNYLTDNAYYFGALDVAADGAIPKISYSISVIDLAPLNEEYEDIYDFDLADVTYIEDIGMFGYDKHTGLPNRLKVLCSSISEGLDDPSKDTIDVQNFTTSFQDLFQQVTASVQSLTYNENIYKRSSNFTSLQNITTSSLQGALDTNDLTLLGTQENNIQVDNTGTNGSDINNHANKYKLDGQGLYFSNDGGQHWSVGVGPSGINADYIRVGTLDAGKIRISDSAYTYFAWDKEGIIAYRDPQAINTDTTNINDAAIFNKYGLSIVEKDKIKLRAGYAFNGKKGDIDAGKMSTETELADEVGFYLYNTNGEVIFSTSTASENGDQGRETASLKLIGEMLVTNNSLRTVVTKFDYSNKYVFGSMAIAPYIFSSVRNPISSIPIPEPPETDPDGLNTCDISNTLYSYEEAAAYLFNTEHLTKVQIVKGSVAKIMELGATTTLGLIEHYLYTDGNKNTISRNNKISSVITTTIHERGVSTTKTVIYYPWQNNSIYIENFSTFTQVKLFSDLTTEAIYDHDKVNESSLTYYQIDGNNLVLKNRNAYFVSNNWYRNKSGDSGVGTVVDASVALYLNNPSLDDATDGVNGFAQRMFVCCGQNGNEVKNLFSVLKDGTAYFGGTILDKQYQPTNRSAAATELQDKIYIDAPGIKIDKDGNMFIAFGRIMDADNPGTSLPQYIGDVIQIDISNASGPIYDAIADVVQMVTQTTGGLQDQINEILREIQNRTLIKHGHGIIYKDYTFSDPGGVMHKNNCGDIQIDTEYIIEGEHIKVAFKDMFEIEETGG